MDIIWNSNITISMRAVIRTLAIPDGNKKNEKTKTRFKRVESMHSIKIFINYKFLNFNR